MKKKVLLIFVCVAVNLIILSLLYISRFAGNEVSLVLCTSNDSTGCAPVTTGVYRTTRDAVYYPSPLELTPPVGWSYKPDVETKYFQEADGVPHADAKYYNSQYFHNPETRRHREMMMLHAFGKFADEHSLPYWIVHGSLIGYYFNEHMLPWDDDIDLQMTYGSLVELAKYNQTRIGDNFFVIDVNPNMVYRTEMDFNTIDARIIDTRTGAFMDITAVAAVHKVPFGGKPVYSCKSPHHYKYNDLFPLHRAVFETIHTWRPHNMEQILTDEYGSGVLTNLKFRDWEFNGTEWNRMP